MEPARLFASDLACRRGERLLFRGLSLALAPGEALQVSGPNGTGKSSLIRILAGLLRPYAGTVERSGGQALLDERPALDEHLPLGRALAFWQRLDGQRADLTRLGLADLTEVPFGYLSTGQKKRAALARIIAQGAPIWLLDEPLNGLDVAAVALVETIIAEHCAGGGIALVASHQPIALPGARVLALSDYTVGDFAA
jgi:heme exporter protein A